MAVKNDTAIGPIPAFPWYPDKQEDTTEINF